MIVTISLTTFIAAQTVNTASRRLDSQSYLVELDKWAEYLRAVRDGAVRPERPDLPPGWTVITSAGEYHVSNRFLFNTDTPTSATTALRRIDLLRRALTEVSDAPEKRTASGDIARRILSQREFRRVQMPGPQESWRDRLQKVAREWAERILVKLFRHGPEMRSFGSLLVWIILLAAAATLLLWLRRVIIGAQAEALVLTAPADRSVSSKPMETWLGEARSAAHQGNYRLAVRFGYWAAIAGLERAGAWKPDVARTPREYLRLARNSSFYGALLPLTKQFEHVWYANRPVTATDFDDCLKCLGELGWG